MGYVAICEGQDSSNTFTAKTIDLFINFPTANPLPVLAEASAPPSNFICTIVNRIRLKYGCKANYSYNGKPSLNSTSPPGTPKPDQVQLVHPQV